MEIGLQASTVVEDTPLFAHAFTGGGSHRGEVSIISRECLVGFEQPECLPACRPSIRIDERMLGRLGGNWK